MMAIERTGMISPFEADSAVRSIGGTQPPAQTNRPASWIKQVLGEKSEAAERRLETSIPPCPKFLRLLMLLRFCGFGLSSAESTLALAQTRMLHRPTTPAQQLRSVAERYAGPLVCAEDRHAEPALTCYEQPCLTGAAADEMILALQRLEAVLFLSREPLTSRKLSQYANLADGTQARTLVRRLNERYDAAGRAFRVEHVAGGYQMLTRRKFARWLRRLEHVPGETRLSAPALETLAVIAYRQPVPRADIEAVRGVNCGEILRQLMERELVRIDGRSEELGRPYLYSTTRRFLQIFGLVNLEELPGREALQTSPLPSLPPVFPQPSEPPEPSDAPGAEDAWPATDEPDHELA
jgi:segregation and condensation protein B